MSDRLRVLLVEDNPGDADLILELLPLDGPEVFEIVCVNRLSLALERVGTDRFDIILLDLGLPDSDGLETLRVMRRHAADLPIVLLTGNSDEQTGVAAVRERAQDYLIKGQINKNLLYRSMKYAIERNKADRMLRHLNDTLEERIVERTALLTAANETLRIEIAERRQVEASLQEARNKLAEQMKVQARNLHEKEVLLKEIHHRVKNNLQVISSMVNLQADAIDSPEARMHFQDIRDRVRSMALVHEKLYQSEDLAYLPLDEYVKGLLHYLRHAYGNTETSIRFTLELQPVLISVEKAVPCGLILNELITNALKHAFRGRLSGEITAELLRGEDGVVCLRVGDDGIGIAPGFDWRQSGSLGLRLVQMLAGQLNAAVTLDRGSGTKFEITFKLQEAVDKGEWVRG